MKKESIEKLLGILLQVEANSQREIYTRLKADYFSS
jgi:hypothetical protein